MGGGRKPKRHRSPGQHKGKIRLKPFRVEVKVSGKRYMFNSLKAVWEEINRLKNKEKQGLTQQEKELLSKLSRATRQ